MKLLFSIVSIVCGFAFSLFAQEEQIHGIHFEQIVVDAFMGRGYTEEWDIPGKANIRHPGIPVSIKLMQEGRQVYLSDALRQRRIDHDFILVIGFYKKIPNTKKIEIQHLHRLHISPRQWNAVWGKVTLDMLETFNREIKKGSVAEAQAFAKKRAAELRAMSNGMKIFPKINAQQRRIQCGMDYEFFCRTFIGEANPPFQSRLQLYEMNFPRILPAGPRLRIKMQ
jgi:hypothetical protein